MNEALHVVCPHCDTINRVPRERLNDGGTCGRCKQKLFERKPVELTAKSFDVHTGKSDLPVVVDFWAPWCGPCRMMAPHFEQAAGILEPQFRLAKLNTEAEPEIGARFHVQSIPTLAIFKHGREIARQAGALDAARLSNWVRRASEPSSTGSPSS